MHLPKTQAMAREERWQCSSIAWGKQLPGRSGCAAWPGRRRGAGPPGEPRRVGASRAARGSAARGSRCSGTALRAPAAASTCACMQHKHMLSHRLQMNMLTSSSVFDVLWTEKKAFERQTQVLHGYASSATTDLRLTFCVEPDSKNAQFKVCAQTGAP